MPREEQLPPSKDGRLASEITVETTNFETFVEPSNFSTLLDSQKVDLLIDFINKSFAINSLIVEDLKERIEVLESL